MPAILLPSSASHALTGSKHAPHKAASGEFVAPDQYDCRRLLLGSGLVILFHRAGKRARLSTTDDWGVLRIPTVLWTLLILCPLCLLVSACASGSHVADVPHWMGGLPPDAPPRPGTPEYDAWQAQRAKEARPKTGNTNQPTR
jgi:hypothetical protein